MEQIVNARTFVELVNSGRAIQSEMFGTWFSSTDKLSGKQLIEDLTGKTEKAEKHFNLMQQYVSVLTAEDIDSVINDMRIERLFKGVKDTATRDRLIKDYKDAIAKS